MFFSEKLVQSYVSLLHHGWLSQEGQSEAYNECHRNSSKVFLFKNFLAQNPTVGGHFNQKKTKGEESMDDDIDIPDNKDFNEGQVSNFMFEMHRKNLSQALYRLWIFEELKDRNKIGKMLFGPFYKDNGDLVTYQDSVEEFLAQVDVWRTDEIYKHTECTDSCKKRGCGRVWSMDGNWKLAYAIW